MRVVFRPIDWYHCNIYERRFFFLLKLIARAELNIKDELTLEFFNPNIKTLTIAPILAMQAKQLILNERNK